MKICIKCKENKLSSNYGLNKRAVDGLNCYCKPCKRIMENRTAQLSHRKAKKRVYNQLGQVARSSAAYSLQIKARGIFAFHIKSGKIKRGNCEVCNKENAEGHHDDYSKPLEVRWLCRKHHAEHHSKLRDANMIIAYLPIRAT